MNITTLIIYFLVGVVQDFCFTMNVKYVALKKVFMSIIFSFLTVFISMMVLYNIINEIDAQKSVVAIVVYSLGIACGTLVAMKLPTMGKK